MDYVPARLPKQMLEAELRRADNACPGALAAAFLTELALAYI